MMPTWANFLIGFAGVVTASGVVGWWLNRRLNQEIARKTHIEAESAVDEALEQAREQTRVWYKRWQEEVDARTADRVTYRSEINSLKGRVERLEEQIVNAGLIPVNGA